MGARKQPDKMFLLTFKKEMDAKCCPITSSPFIFIKFNEPVQQISLSFFRLLPLAQDGHWAWVKLQL